MTASFVGVNRGNNTEVWTWDTLLRRSRERYWKSSFTMIRLGHGQRRTR